MINFSVAQDTIKSALIYHLVYLVYGLFIWDFSGLLRKYTLSQLNHMRRPNQSRKHFVFAYNFVNKNKSPSHEAYFEPFLPYTRICCSHPTLTNF